MSSEIHSNVSIPHELHGYIPAAILRLKYIFPDLTIERTETGVTFRGPETTDQAKLEREIAYQVYRESIFQQTLPMRRCLYQMLAL